VPPLPKQETPPGNTRVWIGIGLETAAFSSERELRSYFSEFGELTEATLSCSPSSGHTAFISYSTEAGVEAVLGRQHTVQGIKLCVQRVLPSHANLQADLPLPIERPITPQSAAGDDGDKHGTSTAPHKGGACIEQKEEDKNDKGMGLFRRQLMELLMSQGPVPLKQLLAKHQSHFKLDEQVDLRHLGATQGLQTAIQSLQELELIPWGDGPNQGAELLVLLSTGADTSSIGSERASSSASSSASPIPSPSPTGSQLDPPLEAQHTNGAPGRATTQPAQERPSHADQIDAQIKALRHQYEIVSALPPPILGENLATYIARVAHRPKCKVVDAIFATGVPAYDFHLQHVMTMLYHFGRV